MFTLDRPRAASWFAAVALVFAIVATTPVPCADAPAMPDDVREPITAVLQKKIGGFLETKNAEGVANVRGNFSREYKKVDDSTYTASLQKFTAEGTVEKVERFRLTVAKDASGKWAIAKEELVDSWDGLRRTDRLLDEFHNFDGFRLERYGMKVTAGRGSLYLTRFEGKPSVIVISAPDLAYEYTPPPNLNYYATYREIVLREYPDDFVFRPDHIVLKGDGESLEAFLGSLFSGRQKASVDATVPELQKLHADARREYEKNRKENPFFGFRRPLDKDRKTWSLEIKRRGGVERWIWIDYDNHQPWDVNFGASDPGFEGRVYPYTIFGYYSDELLASGASPYDLERREDAEALDFDLDRLVGSVDIGLEDELAIEGDFTYGITIKRTIRELPFRISRLRQPGNEGTETKHPKLTINVLQDGDGNDLTWVQTGAFSGLIVFPGPLAAGAKLTLKMRFRNEDSIYKINPSYSAMDRLGWIPLVRFTDPIEEFDMTVRVKDKYRALGPGKLASEKKERGCQVTRWVSQNPVSFPTVIFGDYIDDGPKIKATKLDGTEIPVRVWVDKTSTHTLDETSVSSLDEAIDRVAKAEGGARGIRTKQLSSIADQAVNALNLYREVTGQDYKYDKLDLVCDPLGSFYGQAPASIIFLGFGVFRGEGWVANLGTRDSSNISRFNKDVVAHETGHQWWGGLTGNANERHYWFVESLTEYMAGLYVENVRGRKAYEEKVQEWRRAVMETELLSSVQNGYAVWGGEYPGAAYVANVYDKGPYALHVLRETFGDEKFFKFLKDLAGEFAEKQIVTRDIQRVAEKSFGGNMDWFFDEWVRGVGLPQYAILYEVRATEDGKFLVDGRIKQRVLAGKKGIELPGVFFKSRGFLTFEFADGRKMKWPAKAKSPGEAEKMFIVDGAETPLPKIKLPEKPIAVYFNRDGEILAHDVLINRSW